MTLDPATFGYLKPTDDQMAVMAKGRLAALNYADWVEANVPEGPDKTYILRAIRTVSMWITTAISRQPDGAPRP